MSNLFTFTDEKLSDIKPPTRGEASYRDKQERGLTLRVSYGGVKTFYFYMSVNGKPKKVKIGNFPQISTIEARNRFVQIKSQIKAPNDTVSDSISESFLTFRVLFNKYINNYAKHNLKPKTIKEIKAIFNAYDPVLGGINIHHIKKSDIVEIFNAASNRSIYSANKLLLYLNAIFNKGIEWDLTDKNPAKGIKHHKEKSRERYITKEEMPRFLEAVSKYPDQIMRDFVLIALFTGQRRSNVLSMEWESISFKNETWSIRETKNGDPHVVPLTIEAIAVLNSRFACEDKDERWVFPSPSKSGSSTGHLQEPKKGWKKIVTQAGLEDIRIHDLRRTCGSWMAIDGASRDIIGKMLGHKSYQSTGVYARLSNEPVKKCISRVSSLMLSTAK